MKSDDGLADLCRLGVRYHDIRTLPLLSFHFLRSIYSAIFAVDT